MKKNRSKSSNSSKNSEKSKSEGNTKQISPAVRWCFTLHDYSDEDIERLIVPIYRFSIFSCEMGKSGETKHLQGYFEFKSKLRPKKLYNDKIHWEISKGNRQQNIDYILKEGGDYYVNGQKIEKLKIIKELRPWQKALEELLLQPADDRKIIWRWESKGGSGKSVFSKYICHNYDAILVEGQAGDIKDGIRRYYLDKVKYPKIVIIDIPRCSSGHISYRAIESIKNGIFFSTKYETGMCIFNAPHIVVFSNEPPDLEKFSKDRWDVGEI